MNRKETLKRMDALDAEALALRKIIEKDDKGMDSLISYKSAVKILKEKPKVSPSPDEEIRAIIKAANYLDNGYRIWKADFTDNTPKYYPWFRKTASGWVLYAVYCDRDGSCRPGGCYFKEESTARLITERFLSISYTRWLNS